MVQLKASKSSVLKEIIEKQHVSAAGMCCRPHREKLWFISVILWASSTAPEKQLVRVCLQQRKEPLLSTTGTNNKELNIINTQKGQVC